MITIIYAHQPEVRGLKKLVKNNGLDKAVRFLQFVCSEIPAGASPVDSRFHGNDTYGAGMTPYAHPEELYTHRHPEERSDEGSKSVDSSLRLASLASTQNDGEIFRHQVCDGIINVGFAGALRAGFNIEDVVLVKELIHLHNGNKLKAAPVSSFQVLAEKFSLENKINRVNLLTSDKPVINEKLREKLAKESKADIVDMEAFHILEFAKEANIPLVSFKIISDTADSNTWHSISKNKKELSGELGETLIGFLKLIAENVKK